MQNKFKIAVIGIPGKWSTEVLADRLEALTGFRCVIAAASIKLELDTGRLIADDIVLNDLDAVVVKKINDVYSSNTDDRIRLLSILEHQGVRVFSPSAGMLQLVNRLSGTLALNRAGIPMPPTHVTENHQAALHSLLQWKQGVLKPMYSTKARGMVLLKASDPDIVQKFDEFAVDNPILYLQKALNLQGRDLGMVFVAGQYLCTYARVASADTWNTTIHSGGRYEHFDATPSLIDLGQRAQAPFALDFTTVDIALTDTGPVVFEVSAFGGFKGALEGCGVDAAQAYAEHILRVLAHA